MRSVNDIDLTPLPEKIYFNVDREWSEEIIYFLLVDRFHDGHNRQTVPYKPNHYSFERLMSFCGGTIKGITKNLDYIKGLGCTAIWISPVFENNDNSYHGYAVQNFLEIDKRFGTKEDLTALVALAHEKEMKVILDIVMNHTGDNWNYSEGYPDYTGQVYDFGSWKKSNRPIPSELRNPDSYKRMGIIQHWDDYPETREGDIFELKKLNLDENELGWQVQEIMTKIYCYWIKELDLDGFRLDTVKHLAPKAVARFCTNVRTYAHGLGKKSFVIFGEAVGGEKLISKYLKEKKADDRVYQGLDTVLDFPLHFIIADIVRGEQSIEVLQAMYLEREKKANKLDKDINSYITFLDNHDQISQSHKQRLSSAFSDAQVEASLALLYCLPGVPCIYYGTEQLMKGEGNHDVYLRQTLFDVRTNKDYLNRSAHVYKLLKELTDIRSKHKCISSGELFFNRFEIINKEDIEQESCIVFSRILADQEIVCLFNSSSDDLVKLNVQLYEIATRTNEIKTYLFGARGKENIFIQDHKKCISVELKPLQFVILV